MTRVLDEQEPVFSRWVGELGAATVTLSSAGAFVAAGLRWSEPLDAHILLRARAADGPWSGWVNAGCIGHDTDRGSSPVLALSGDPVWTGPAHELQVRAEGTVRDVTVLLVSDAATAGDGSYERAAAAAAPSYAVESRARSLTAARASAELPLAHPILHAGPGQPPIIARRAWSQGHGPVAPPQYGRVRMAFVHHSDGTNGYSAAQVPQIIRAIYEFHVYTRGWNDIGYNFAVDRFGRIWEARLGGIDQAVVGAQAGGYNLESFGAVLLGDYMSAEPSRAGVRAMERLIAWKLALHGVPVTGMVTVEVDPPDAFYTRFRPGQHVSLPRVAGHRDGCTTSCPGNDLYARLPGMRGVIRGLAGRQTQLSLELGTELPPTGSATAPPERVTRSQYLSMASVTIEFGAELEVAGNLQTLTGAGIGHAPLVLQQLTLNGDTPATAAIGDASTDAGGRWSAVLKPTRSILLRALHEPAPATASPLALVQVAPAVAVRLTEEQRKIEVAGSVRPALEQVTVEIRERDGKRRPVKTKTIPAGSGAFSHAFSLADGSYQLRVTAAARGDYVAGASGWKDFRISS